VSSKEEKLIRQMICFTIFEGMGKSTDILDILDVLFFLLKRKKERLHIHIITIGKGN
jgi:hypothetical protein